MDSNTMAIIFLGFGVLLTVLGLYSASRRRLSMWMTKDESRGTHTRVELRGGPAILAGLSVAHAGMWLVVRLLPSVTQGGEDQAGSVSFLGPIVLLVLGLLAGWAWQIARNAKELLGSEEVKQKVIENIEGAIEAKQQDEMRKPQKGISPE